MSMSTGDMIAAMIGAIMVLIINLYAFRSDASAAGHGRQQMIRMAAIWVTIIVCLTLAIRFVRP
ncbi:MAG: hypothetical protein ACKOPG_02940 [Novosphingobium sp.]